MKSARRLFPLCFQGLCGFRPALEIAGFLDTVHEFRAVVGPERAASFEAAVHKPEVSVVGIGDLAIYHL